MNPHQIRKANLEIFTLGAVSDCVNLLDFISGTDCKRMYVRESQGRWFLFLDWEAYETQSISESLIRLLSVLAKCARSLYLEKISEFA